MRPLPVAPAPAADLPPGFRLRLEDATTLDADGRVLLGGEPFRITRLGGPDAALLRGWLGGATVGQGQREQALARRLVAGGLVRPAPPPAAAVPPVTVVIPVRYRPAQLRRLLAALSTARDVTRTVVVDDASADPAQVAAVAAAHGVELLRRRDRGRVAAARTAGLAVVGTPLVAFVDSDTVARPGWLPPLAAHLADPRVALVAPRITALGAGRRPVGRYEGWRLVFDDVAVQTAAGR